MKRKDLPNGTVIDHRDANARTFVWLIKPDGERVLYGVQRLCIEYGLSMGTFWYRWKLEGCPDDVRLTTLKNPEESYSKKVAGWTVDGAWFSSLRSVANFIGRSESTISERYIELGRREATFEELAERKPYPDRRKKTSKREPRTVLCADGRRYTIAQLAESTGLSRQVLWKRANEKNWVLGQHDLQLDNTAGSDKQKPVDPSYMSGRYAHIPLGDLCHLSGRGKNTGAGKGEIPDKEWIGMIGRTKAISSSTYGISLAAFNR